MRPKVALLIVCVGLALIVCLVALRPNNGRDSEPLRNPNRAAKAVTDPSLGGVITGSASSRKMVPPPRLPTPASRQLYAGAQPPDASRPASALSPEEIEDAINQRILELSDLALKGDSASLNIVLSELTNSSPEIRAAALDGLMQSGNRDAIPGLQEAADRSTDPREKAKLAEAIEFLTLPSLSEITPATSAALQSPFGKR